MNEKRRRPTPGVRLKEVSVRLVDVSVKTQLNVITPQAETFSLALPQAGAPNDNKVQNHLNIALLIIMTNNNGIYIALIHRCSKRLNVL